MRPADNIEKAVKKLNFTASTKLHDRILDDVMEAQQESMKTKSALSKPKTRSIIMKSRIGKLAAAAVIIIGISIGISYIAK
ncbi:MAG: hypothetical protein ACYS67_09785, partial [Planctomycetota bacterium]